MEEFIQTHQMRTKEKLSDDLKKACQALIDSPNGIQTISFSENLITVGYNPYQITEENVEKLISDLGIKISNKPEKQGFLRRWLKDMAKSNKESLGSGRLDCCDLNHKKHQT